FRWTSLFAADYDESGGSARSRHDRPARSLRQCDLDWTGRNGSADARPPTIAFKSGKKATMRDPVIFIGMHRSGTSMLGRLLEELGMFFGAYKDENNEALFFQDLNEWLLAQCGGRWDNPRPFNAYFWRNEDAARWAETYLRNLLASPRCIQFLGARRFLQGGMRQLNAP